jgi:hypothetical protein
MRITTQLLAATLAVALDAATAQAATFSTNTTIGTGDITYDGQEIIVSGCTVTIDGSHAFNSLLVTNNGTVTHSLWASGQTNRLELTIAQDLVVAAGSRIEVSGKGYTGTGGSGNGPGGGSAGEGGGGGGHGGDGGNSKAGVRGGTAFGSITQPTDLGSAGGAGSGAAGGAGGGAIRLVA